MPANPKSFFSFIKPAASNSLSARALSDVDIAVINNGVATKAGKDPKNDPIFLEKSNSDAVKPYINIVAVNDKDLDNKTYAKIVELYHSKEAQKALQEDVCLFIHI
ncbi:hypothetical protein ksw1_26900 [Staphylococcus aureus]|nr:hypothetical protein ksw1_26900 [Staphylococcus aureus]